MITEAYYQNEWIEQCRSTKAKNYSPRHEAFFGKRNEKCVDWFEPWGTSEVRKMKTRYNN